VDPDRRPAVALSDPTAAAPTFTAPPVGSGRRRLATVTVSDGVARSTDEVQVLVTNLNQVPTANAGADQTIDEGGTVALQATASSDPDADLLTFLWTQLSGPSALLSDPTSATTTFTAPAVPRTSWSTARATGTRPPRSARGRRAGAGGTSGLGTGGPTSRPTVPRMPSVPPALGT
jgi:hypothetical protein